jgi:hypothetical protein
VTSSREIPVAEGVLIVEAHPASPDQATEFHDWYEHIHMKEMVALDGVISAQRFAPLAGEGPFVAVYRIQGDDLDALAARLTAVTRSGKLSPPVGIRLDPPPTVRYLRLVAEVN